MASIDPRKSVGPTALSLAGLKLSVPTPTPTPLAPQSSPVETTVPDWNEYMSANEVEATEVAAAEAAATSKASSVDGAATTATTATTNAHPNGDGIDNDRPPVLPRTGSTHSLDLTKKRRGPFAGSVSDP